MAHSVSGINRRRSLGMAGVTAHASMPQNPVGFTIESTSDTNTALYAEVERGKFYAAGEFRRRIWNLVIPEFHAPLVALDSRAWYLMSAYRVHRIVQVGAYYSRFQYPGVVSSSALLPYIVGNGTSDWVVASRVDPNPHIYFKFEGHYMDGNTTALGFYPSVNSGNPDRLTRLLVARIGFTF